MKTLFRIASCLWVVFPISSEVVAPIARAAGAEPIAARAELRVRAGRRSPHAIPRYTTGKFAEHLGANIYHGMDAQVLRNPTLADWPFGTGQTTPDGVTTFHFEREAIAREIRRQALRLGWPEGELAALVQSREDGLACWWTRVGKPDSVRVSPDAGPHGGRAQRVEVASAGEGIAQWTYLPLHRVRKYEFELLCRSPAIDSLGVSVSAADSAGGPGSAAAKGASARVKGVSAAWRTFSGSIEIPVTAPGEKPWRIALTADTPGQFVVARFLLRPADHVGGADPDVIRLLRESRLPILRWPGGNFVSGYHWEDGVGPADRRPTRPNYAWGGVETNLFGTDEFVAFCRSVGCEPMICVNAGSGTPEEAARWVQYCNGSAQTPMGARRAAAGHREPYRIRHWEIGNELWGRWQVHWTTASGYVDRYLQFAEAMRAADPTIQLYACGAPVLWGKNWNDTLIAGTAPQLAAITDHPLIGGGVSPATDPLDVFRDFMAVPDVLEKKWGELRQDMLKAGVKEPRLAVTELQMFAHLNRAAAGEKPARLTPENLVSPGTLAEALYDVLIYHASVRLAPLVEMVTHSATVNHGGGLRKQRERVFANPCHYAQAAFAELAGAAPVAVEIESPVEQAPRVLADLRNATPASTYRAIDALAALATDGSLLISIVHRGTSGPVRLTVHLEDFAAHGPAEVRRLTADVPWAANTLENPERVKPADEAAEVNDGKLTLDLNPFTVVRVRVRPD